MRVPINYHEGGGGEVREQKFGGLQYYVKICLFSNKIYGYCTLYFHVEIGRGWTPAPFHGHASDRY